MNIITDERCTEYSMPGHPERPYRIAASVKRLREQSEIAIAWHDPIAVEEASLLKAHTQRHIQRIRAAEQDFDGDTPAYDNIGDHAERSVGSALRALQFVQEGKPALSLIRPPGHHATQDRAMGFCYFNSIAIAALLAPDHGFKRVAVYDFDVHHGNGTEAILKDKPGVAFASVHQYPCYPGTGTSDVGSNCFNHPVSPETPRGVYREILTEAFEKLLRFKPDVIAVSAGFDAYVKDPIAQETLEAEDFQWIGRMIQKAGVPFFSVLEGGYSDDLPELVLAYLRGIHGE